MLLPGADARGPQDPLPGPPPARAARCDAPATRFDLGPTDPDTFQSRAGLCAGWAADGRFMSAVREHSQIPTPVGPPSGRWDTDEDPLAWHAVPPMEPSSTRRRRLIDVHVGDDGRARVAATFRDSHADDQLVERSFHEYTVDATLTGPDHRVEAVAVQHLHPP